jgi:hypothetical protein
MTLTKVQKRKKKKEIAYGKVEQHMMEQARRTNSLHPALHGHRCLFRRHTK